jgi:hypothetical protein
MPGKLNKDLREGSEEIAKLLRNWRNSSGNEPSEDCLFRYRRPC